VIKHPIWTEITQAIQVTRELALHNTEREVDGLVQAMEKLQLKEGYILTYNQEEREESWYKIHILPVWKWILIQLQHT
jgi:predicted AAA+ superfamily ATPase